MSSRRDLSDALIATGIPFLGHGDFVQWSRIFGAVAPEVAGIRRNGSAALDLAWVAAGRFDGYLGSRACSRGTSPPGILLVKEAGGFVTDYRGGDRPMERNEFLAATGAALAAPETRCGGTYVDALTARMLVALLLALQATDGKPCDMGGDPMPVQQCAVSNARPRRFLKLTPEDAGALIA